MSSVQALRQEDDALEQAVAKKTRFRASQNESPQESVHNVALVDQSPNPRYETATNDEKSPSELIYTGEAVIPITSFLHIVTPEEDSPRGIWPIFRLLVSVEEREYSYIEAPLTPVFLHVGIGREWINSRSSKRWLLQ